MPGHLVTSPVLQHPAVRGHAHRGTSALPVRSTPRHSRALRDSTAQADRLSAATVRQDTRVLRQRQQPQLPCSVVRCCGSEHILLAPSWNMLSVAYCLGRHLHVHVSCRCVGTALGRYSVAGSTSCSNCTAGYACPAASTNSTVMQCPSGKYSVAGSGVCSDCAAGYACPVAGSTTAYAVTCGTLCITFGVVLRCHSALRHLPTPSHDFQHGVVVFPPTRCLSTARCGTVQQWRCGEL